MFSWNHPLNHYMAAFMKISRMNPEIFAGEIVKITIPISEIATTSPFSMKLPCKKWFIFRVNYRCGFCWLIHHVLVKSDCDGEPQKTRIQYVINQHFPTEPPRFFSRCAWVEAPGQSAWPAPPRRRRRGNPEEVGRLRAGPRSDVCWFIHPMNTIVINYSYKTIL